MAYELSIVIPARHEEWLSKTIENVLANTSETCGVIAVLDGEWPMAPIADHPRLSLIHNPVSIGQRASINLGVRASRAKYVCKLDGHCVVGPNFDQIMLKDCEPNWIVTPRLYNLYVYDWRCITCDARTYQGPRPKTCESCHNNEFDKVVVWLIRDGEHWSCSECKEFFHSKDEPTLCARCGREARFENIHRKVSDGMRFDSDLSFQYWRDFPYQEGLAAFIHAKGEQWIERLMLADLASPSEKMVARMREYVVAYESLPLPKKYELRTRASKALVFIRANAGAVKMAQKDRLLNLIETVQGHLIETMSMLGACWLLSRELYWEIGGCDESFGSWGAQGTEMSAKCWLHGGKLIVNRNTFYGHMFRTRPGDAFPYGMKGSDQDRAKQYSRNLWRNNLWPGQKYPLSFMLRRFAPIPGWTEADIKEQEAREVGWKPIV